MLYKKEAQGKREIVFHLIGRWVMTVLSALCYSTARHGCIVFSLLQNDDEPPAAAASLSFFLQLVIFACQLSIEEERRKRWPVTTAAAGSRSRQF